VHVRLTARPPTQLSPRAFDEEEEARPPVTPRAVAAPAAAAPVPPTRLLRPAAAADLSISSGSPDPVQGALVPEPSIAANGQVSLLTWNWYAAVTTNGGASFSYLNPFLQNAYGGFCCDQSAYYDPSRDLYIWVVQFVADNTGNAVRLLVAKGASQLESGNFLSWDVTPQQVGALTGVWYDQPKVARSSNDLYIEVTSYNGDSFVGSVMLRFALDDLAAGNPLKYDPYHPSVGTPAFADGATDTMYFAGHVTTSKLRVFRWPESAGAAGVTSFDVSHDPYPNTLPYRCPRSGGSQTGDWCQRDDDRVMGGWISGGVLGFDWDASQGQVGSRTFPFPHVHFVRIGAASQKLIDQPILWSDKYAFAYAAVAHDGSGDLGGTVMYGGGNTFENCGIIIHDGYTAGTGFWELDGIETSDADSEEPLGGDYLAARADPTNANRWNATCYALHGGGAGSNMRPYALSFGRQTSAVPLTVSKAGTGSGSVGSSPGGIGCGDICVASFPHDGSVTLTATPASDSRFDGWSGDCSGAGACTLTMSAPHTVQATFTRLQVLTLTKVGSGTGQVTSSPAGINCGSTCSAGYTKGTSVTLTAAAAAGSAFTGWSGDCSGTAACTLTMNGAHAVQATFAKIQTLRIAKRGSGSGHVHSAPAGIDCGSTCSAKFGEGVNVTLTAAPGGRSRFAGWSAPCTGTGACVVSMTADITVTASFEALCIVPRVVGLPLGRATGAIRTAHCAVGKTRKRTSGRPKGSVLSQHPGAGSRAPGGTRVNLVVSKGR
jgi:Divergent InlB B-repeat domain/PASTA domain